MDAALKAGAGISLPWFMVLSALQRAEDGFMNMSELARQVSLSSSGATRLVDRVLEAGYVERVDCESDRRVSYIRITHAGREVLGAAAPSYRKSVQEYLSNRLEPGDLGELQRIMGRLHE